MRIGAGVSKTDFQELYSSTLGPSLRFHRWNFTWGLGGGLRYRFSTKIDGAVFVDGWITEDQIVDADSWGYEKGISGPYAMVASGFRVWVSL